MANTNAMGCNPKVLPWSLGCTTVFCTTWTMMKTPSAIGNFDISVRTSRMLVSMTKMVVPMTGSNSESTPSKPNTIASGIPSTE